MNRLFVVFVVFVVFAVFCVTVLGITASSAAAKPSVLFIIVDDLTTTLGCYGNAHVHTPHMDRLAARGVRFDHAYTQFALCNPSRCSFLTGCYPERTKVFDLSTSLRTGLPDVVTLPQHFKDHGYATGRIGKVFHVPDPKTKLDVELGAALHKDNEILVEAKQANDPDDKPRGKSKGDGYNRTYAASGRPAADFTDYQIADDAVATLEEFRDRPFFLAVGFIRPHTPFVAPQAYFDAVDQSKITLPPFYREQGESTAKIPQSSLRPNNNVFRYAAPTQEEARDAVRAYLASTSFVDAQIGRVLAKLKELQIEENTIVVLTGDHGYQLGEHGLWAKQTLFEGANHVPLLIAAPGAKPGARAGLAEQVDIYPTLCDLAGLPLPKHLQGRSLKPMLDAPEAKGRQIVVSTMVAAHTKLVGHSVRTDAFRYITWDEGRGGELLYDLRDDPDELHNLADHPAQAERMLRMRRRLADHLNAVSSPVPEGSALQPTLPTQAPAESAIPIRLGIPGTILFWNQCAVQFQSVPTRDIPEIAVRAMKAADRNQDGRLDLAEYLPLDVQAKHHGDEHFTAGDADKDRLLDVPELAAALRKQTWFAILSEGAEACFARLDANHDGKLDAAEYRKISRMGAHAEQHFQKADVDRNKFLNKTEFTRHTEATLQALEVATPPGKAVKN